MKKAKIYIGQMRERIEIQRPVETANGINEVATTWEPVACVYARVEYPKAGSGEAFHADHQVAITRTEFTIRYRCDVTEKHRIVYRGKPYDILTITEPVIRTYQTLITEQRDDNYANG